MIRCAFNSIFLQLGDELVQRATPELSEPLRVSEPPDNGGADGVVSADESTAQDAVCQRVVPEPTQRPYLWAVIGPINAGGNIAAVGVVMAIPAKEVGITSASAMATCIVMMIAT